MNFAGSGLMLAIIVALWLLVFVPAWFQRSSESEAERGQKRQVARQIRSEVRANLQREKRQHLVVQERVSSSSRVRVSGKAHTLAAQIFRLRSLRKALVVTLVAGMTASVASVTMLSTAVEYWFGVVGGVAVVCLAAWGLRAVGDRLAAALDSSVAIRGQAISALNYSTRAAAADASEVEAAANPRAWSATELPAPRSNVGTIVETAFAEVVPLISESSAPQEIELDLDQILARRRQVG